MYPKQNENNDSDDELLFNDFFKNLLSFLDEVDSDQNYSVDKMITSGNFQSFSPQCFEGLIYQKCNFGNFMSSTWTNSANGLKSSSGFNDEGPSIFTTHLNKLSLHSASSLNNFANNNSTKKKKQGCQFCFKNGEPKLVYTGHILKTSDGKVLCPILRRYICNLCGATGSYSHTRKYCPKYMEMLIWQEFYENQASMVL